MSVVGVPSTILGFLPRVRIPGDAHLRGVDGVAISTPLIFGALFRSLLSVSAFVNIAIRGRPAGRAFAAAIALYLLLRPLTRALVAAPLAALCWGVVGALLRHGVSGIIIAERPGAGAYCTGTIMKDAQD